MVNLNTIFWITLILYILAIILVFTPYYVWGLWLGLIASLLALYAAFVNYQAFPTGFNIFWIVLVLIIVGVWIYNLYQYYTIKNLVPTV